MGFFVTGDFAIGGFRARNWLGKTIKVMPWETRQRSLGACGHLGGN
jgi:hypothetical protein